MFLYLTQQEIIILYDVNTNLLCKISDDSSKILRNKAVYNRELRELEMAGLLKTNLANQVHHPLDSQIEEILSTRINRLVLQLTQQCNLRCSYCIYSGNYQGTRMHSNNEMSVETLIKSLEFLATNCSKSNHLHIGFYGGEPLLRFDLIQKTFSYMEANFSDKLVTYSMTTNASLLSDEIIEAMIAHNVAIQISLDGPEDVHNKNRRNRHGEGSYSKVIANLKKIYQKSTEYYHKRVTFNAVLDGYYTYDDILPFFTTHYLFRNNFVKFSGINMAIPNNVNTYPARQKARKLSYGKNAALYYYKSITDPQYAPNQTIENLFSFRIIENGLRKHPFPLSSECIHSGLCIPGVSRLFVASNGSFYVCEKVPEQCDGPSCIGNLNSGFNIHRVRELLNLQNTSQEGCSSCWAIQLCRVCAAMVNLNDGERDESLDRLCVSHRAALEKQLIDYCTYCEIKKLYATTYTADKM